MARTRKQQGTKPKVNFDTVATVYLIGYTVAVSGGRSVKRTGQGVTKKGKVERRDALVSVTEHEARGLAERIRGAFAGAIRDLCASTLWGPATDEAGLALLKTRLAVHEARADAFNARPEAGVEGVGLTVEWAPKAVGLTVAEATARAVEGLRAIYDAARAGVPLGLGSALQTHENVGRLLPGGILRDAAAAGVREAKEGVKVLKAGERNKARPDATGRGLMLAELEAALAMLAAPVDGGAEDPDATAPPPSMDRGSINDPEPTAPIMDAA